MMVYERTITLSKIKINQKLGTVSGINDSGALVIMLIKHFEELYTMKSKEQL